MYPSVIIVVVVCGGGDSDGVGNVAVCSVIWDSDAEMLAQCSIWLYNMLGPTSPSWLSGYQCCFIIHALVLSSISSNAFFYILIISN